MANEFIIKNGAIIRPGGTLEIGDSTDTGYIFPLTDGSSGQALVTDGAGNLSFGPVGGTPGGTTTQMQYNNGGVFGGDSGMTTNGAGSIDIDGDLDVDNLNFDGNTITATSGDDIILSPSASGKVSVTGTGTAAIQSGDDADIAFLGGDSTSGNAGAVLLKGGDDTGATKGGSVTIEGGIGTSGDGDVIIQGLTYPDTDGTNGQVLTTDGGGNLSFTTVATGATDLDSLTDVTITSPSSTEVLQYNGSQWVNSPAPSGGGANIERFRAVYGGLGGSQVVSIDNATSGINSTSIVGGTRVDATFTGYNYPPVSIITYGYDSANDWYDVRHINSASSQRYMQANSGSAFGSLTTSEALQLGMQTSDTGASSNQHAWVVFIFG